MKFDDLLPAIRKLHERRKLSQMRCEAVCSSVKAKAYWSEALQHFESMECDTYLDRCGNKRQVLTEDHWRSFIGHAREQAELAYTEEQDSETSATYLAKVDSLEEPTESERVQTEPDVWDELGAVA